MEEKIEKVEKYEISLSNWLYFGDAKRRLQKTTNYFSTFSIFSSVDLFLLGYFLLLLLNLDGRMRRSSGSLNISKSTFKLLGVCRGTTQVNCFHF